MFAFFDVTSVNPRKPVAFDRLRPMLIPSNALTFKAPSQKEKRVQVDQARAIYKVANVEAHRLRLQTLLWRFKKMALRLFFGVGFLALSFVLFLGTPPSNAQSDCIGGCIGAYVDCTNSSGGPNCDDQYDRCIERCISRQLLLSSSALELASAIGAASPASIEDMLAGHGGRSAVLAINSYRIEMTKFVNTVPPRFFARRVRLSVEGDKIRRETSNPQGDRTGLELIDEGGQFQAFDMDWAEAGGARSSTPLTTNARRQSAVRTNVAVCSLIPFLEILCDPAASASFLGLEQGNMKYLIAAPGKKLLVHLDESRRISRVEMGRNTFEFADFRRVGSLLLPFVERVSVGDHQVFEFLLSGCEINPTFQNNAFSAAAER